MPDVRLHENGTGEGRTAATATAEHSPRATDVCPLVVAVLREWRIAKKGGQYCGGRCRGLVPKGYPFMTFERDGIRFARCPTCAKAMFGEDPPAVIEESVPVPAPTLPGAETVRQPDFVTPRQVARSVQWNDVKSRQAGERE